MCRHFRVPLIASTQSARRAEEEGLDFEFWGLGSRVFDTELHQLPALIQKSGPSAGKSKLAPGKTIPLGGAGHYGAYRAEKN